MYNKVYIEITNRCNMNCSFCHGHSRTPRIMTEAEFSHVLGQLTDKTQYLYYHLMGEPLTHPLLPKFIRMASEHGYKSIITTNGTLLPRRAQELLSVGVHKINVSLHSFEEGGDEAHARYVRELAEVSKRAADAGTIVVFRLWNRGHDGDRNQMTLAHLKDCIPGDWSENSRGVKIRDRIYLEWGERFEWPDENADIKGDKFFCYGLKDQFGILVDGTVVPCCLDSEGVISLGNIFHEDIGAILHSQRAQAIVEGFRCGKASEDLCRRCGYAQRFIK